MTMTQEQKSPSQSVKKQIRSKALRSLERSRACVSKPWRSKGKTPQHSTARKQGAKSRARSVTKKPLGTPDGKALFDHYDYKPTEAWRNELIRRLKDWAFNDEEALKIGQFRRQEHLSSTRYENLVKNYPDIKEAHNEALLALGDRREIMALKRQLDPSLATKALHVYDPEWREIHLFHSSLKEKEGRAGSANILVQMSDYAPSGKVPDKIEDDT